MIQDKLLAKLKRKRRKMSAKSRAKISRTEVSVGKPTFGRL